MKKIPPAKSAVPSVKPTFQPDFFYFCYGSGEYSSRRGVGGAKEKNNYFWLDAIFPAISRQFSGLTDDWRTVKGIHAARSGKTPKIKGGCAVNIRHCGNRPFRALPCRTLQLHLLLL